MRKYRYFPDRAGQWAWPEYPTRLRAELRHMFGRQTVTVPDSRR
ncbi:hypothetical protein I545_2117 [Mycobacterium kansasii 662]|uniref:Uncharacterized protein n=1 Tax=Mycobacterium kansasii 662 TaxID=1299326 RepID=X7ZL74_MYCKA|nr:hypothetical protein I545_2117 [Mycobacterium kansasii 662]